MLLYLWLWFLIVGSKIYKKNTFIMYSPISPVLIALIAHLVTYRD